MYYFSPIEIEDPYASLIYLHFPLQKSINNFPYTFIDITKKIKNKKEDSITIYNDLIKSYTNKINIINKHIHDNKIKSKICIELILNKLSDIDTIKILKYIYFIKKKDKYTDLILDYFINNKNFYESNNKKKLAVFSGNICYELNRKKGKDKKKWKKCDIDIRILAQSLFDKEAHYNYITVFTKML